MTDAAVGAVAVESRRARTGTRALSVVLGVVAGIAIVYGLGVMHGSGDPWAGTTVLTPATSLGAASLCYLAAAAVGLRWVAWAALPIAANLPFLGLLAPIPWWGVVAIVSGLVTVVGLWRNRHATVVQAVAMLAYFGLGVAALSLASSAGLALAGAALTAHVAWNVHHHRKDTVVTRSFAVWCAALDLTVGGISLVLAVTGAAA